LGVLVSLLTNSMQISTQLVIGKQAAQELSDTYLRQKLAKAKSLAHLQRVMIWADDEPELYHRLVKLCKEHDLETYLWFNVLADTPGYEACVEDGVLNYTNRRGNGQLGSWEKLGQGGEEFRFICPNNTIALDKVFQQFTTLVDHTSFDGVFFDRIRYPSFTNGFESLFTCFCEFCQDKFTRRYGTSLDSYRDKIHELLERLRELDPDELAQYHRLEGLWEIDELKEFFEFRRTSVYDVVQRFSQYVHSQGRQVGLDLFTPSFAPFVSQDYQRLSTCCDWIKPMTYCHVLGPAGVPLEITCLMRAMSILSPKLNEKHIIRFLSRVLGVTLPESGEVIRRQGIPEEFIARELEKICGLSLPDNVQIYCGVEAVHFPTLGLKITKEMLALSLKALQSRADGLVASWDLLHIPEENLEMLGRMKGV